MERHLPSRLHDSEPDDIIGDAYPVRSIQIPDGYQMFMRIVRLLSGSREIAYYSIRDGAEPNADGQERLGSSLIEGFKWALQTPEFADHETEDDDRSQEIGNMMSYALSQGLTEAEVVEQYKQAFQQAYDSD